MIPRYLLTNIGIALFYAVLMYFVVYLYERFRSITETRPWYKDKRYLAGFAFLIVLISLLTPRRRRSKRKSAQVLRIGRPSPMIEMKENKDVFYDIQEDVFYDQPRLSEKKSRNLNERLLKNLTRHQQRDPTPANKMMILQTIKRLGY